MSEVSEGCGFCKGFGSFCSGDVACQIEVGEVFEGLGACEGFGSLFADVIRG